MVKNTRTKLCATPPRPPSFTFVVFFFRYINSSRIVISCIAKTKDFSLLFSSHRKQKIYFLFFKLKNNDITNLFISEEYFLPAIRAKAVSSFQKHYPQIQCVFRVGSKNLLCCAHTSLMIPESLEYALPARQYNLQ